MGKLGRGLAMVRDELADGKRTIATFKGAMAGLVIEIPVLFLAVASAGAGHGDYVLTRILFPFSMLMTLAEGRIGAIGISLALLQYPLYGALIGFFMTTKLFRVIYALLAIHIIAVFACFSGVLVNFSG